MKTFEKVLQSVTEKMAMVAMVAIVACVALVVGDIFKRTATAISIPGVPEIVELISAVILSMGIAYLTFVRGHVSVGVIVERFRPRTQAIFDIITYAIASAFAILLTWGAFEFGLFNQRAGWVTGHLKIPLAPFVYLIGVALALTSVVLIKEVVKAVITARKGGGA
jgi:TRAP-type C4-dicarboxylate transport system permease small subunit